MTESLITLSHISKKFGKADESAHRVLDNINLEIKKGEIFIFVGPSGSGKSTLLRILSGLEKKYDGTLSFAHEIAPNDISFVFQQFALLPWMTVEENIGLGLLARSIPKHEKRMRVEKELKEFGLEAFRKAYPRELSGGMRQRVGIARAFVTNPKVIFMDEPFSELDSFTADELRQELLRIWNARRPTVIMVTHIVEEAIELADRIAVLSPLPGRIEKIVVNNLLRPRHRRTEGFYHLEDTLIKLIKP